MTFQPTAWILVFATLFVGFSEQGCKKDGGGGAAASKQGGPSGNGTKTDGGERVDLQDGSETPEPPKRDDRIDGEKVGRWITGNLLKSEDTLQTMVGNVTQEECKAACIRWCLCTACVSKEDKICQLSTADIVNVDEEKTVQDSADAEQEGVQEDEEVSDDPPSSRRMLTYGTPTTTTTPAPQHVWLKARCNTGIRGLKVAALDGNFNETEFKVEGEEMTAPNCTASCGGSPGCDASEATTTTTTVTKAGIYATKETKTSTKCYHVTGTGIHLTREQSDASNGTQPAAALLVSATACRPQECTRNFLEGFVFADFYNADVSREEVVQDIKTAVECKKKCDDRAKNSNSCTAAVFVQNIVTKDPFAACLLTPRNGTSLVAWNAPGINHTASDYLYFGYLYDKDRPAFVDDGSAGRASPSGAPAVGAIIGGALGAVAVAVLAFVGFRAYKKHKGADAENAAETGSVATSSPKSARKRQAIE